jgi:hypothetical protein
MTSPLTAVCVGRHRYLSEHLGLFFRRIGVDTRCAVGLHNALSIVRENTPDVVICDYDLLTTVPIQEWEADDVFRTIPVVAVSLTRRPDEMQVLDINGIGGFLYLPTLDHAAALRYLEMARQAARFSPTRDWPLPGADARRT